MSAVSPQPGRPLYQAVREAIRDAVDARRFAPGEQIPSTKQLAGQMGVSLVTAHRALQELVTAGVLQRAQGKGTFVHPHYHERKSAPADTRIGLVLHRDASVADFYHGQIVEGLRQAAHELAVDLVLLRYGEDGRAGCGGYLFVNPLPGELETFVTFSGQRHPVLVVGARADVKRIPSIDVDNVDLARQGVNHLCDLGHTRIGYVGGNDTVSNSRDRWTGFRAARRECSRESRSPAQVIRSPGWRLDEAERARLVAALRSPQRPTAVFAAGYYFALDVYAAAAEAGLKVPRDLSLVGVDDPASAAHLSPPLTTLRQPLVEMGHAALTALVQCTAAGVGKIESRQLRGELVMRGSVAAPA